MGSFLLVWEPWVGGLALLVEELLAATMCCSTRCFSPLKFGECDILEGQQVSLLEEAMGSVCDPEP